MQRTPRCISALSSQHPYTLLNRAELVETLVTYADRVLRCGDLHCSRRTLRAEDIAAMPAVVFANRNREGLATGTTIVRRTVIRPLTRYRRAKFHL